MKDSHQAFEGMANHYNSYRPSYPEQILVALREFLEAGVGLDWPDLPTVLDVGSGTGISTRLLRQYLGPIYAIIGVEPGKDMIEFALQFTDANLKIEYIRARAEDLPFGASSIAAVVAAQSIQWFDRPAFYAEARRVLLPGGTLALLLNNRDWQKSPLLEAYEQLLERYGDHYSRYYREFDLYGELSNVEGFETASPVVTSWTRIMSCDDFIGMALSSTKMQAVVRRLSEAKARKMVRQLAQEYAGNTDSLSIFYKTELFLTRRIRGGV